MSHQLPPQWQAPEPHAEPHAAPGRPPKRKWWKLPLLALAAALLLFVIVGALNSGSNPTPAPRAVPTSEAPLSDDPAGPVSTFGPGTYEVGTGNGQVPPGKYRSPGPKDGDPSCYWARLKNTDGSFDSIITNGNAEGPTTITINKTDGAFETRCNWTKAG